MTASAYSFIRAKSTVNFEDAPVDGTIRRSSLNVLVRITDIIKPFVRLPEHGPNRTLGDTGCSHSYVIVHKSMIRRVPQDHDESAIPSNSRNDPIPDTSLDLQHYTEELRRQEFSSKPLPESVEASESQPTHKSRVLKDVYHLIDMLKVPVKHTLYAEFKGKFRDIPLVADPIDKATVKRYLQEKNTTWEYKLATNPSWMCKGRVRRRVPPASSVKQTFRRLRFNCLQCY